MYIKKQLKYDLVLNIIIKVEVFKERVITFGRKDKKTRHDNLSDYLRG